ncbi:MAG: hypothetical protein NTV09_13665 [Bacteroidetes bacterium]|nr:hypothetical protein [Bacteroidota bacterium]
MARKKNILVVTYWSYKDALIQAYTLPYLKIISDQLPRGSKIFLITIEQDHQKMSIDEKCQVKARLRLFGIRLITIKYRKLNFVSLLHWLGTGLYFIFFSFIFRIKFIHAWCTPAGSFGYLLSIFTGKKLIIDSYEPHAEAMVENETWSKNSIEFKYLFYLEKKLSKHAQVIISATEEMKNYAKIKYGVTFKNFYVKPACVDLDAFSIGRKKNDELIKQFKFENKVVCVYAGKFGGIYLTKEVFDFFKACEIFWGDRFRVLLLTSHDITEIEQWCRSSMVDRGKIVVRFVSHADIPDYIGLGDFAITPVKPIPTKKYCTPVKDGEYWALGLPVVIPSNISDDSDLIENNNAGAVLRKFDTQNYNQAIQVINNLLCDVDPKMLSLKIRNIAHTYRNYKQAEKVYAKVYSEELN